MSECIICGTEVEGADICSIHEEDVLFTFTGSDPHDLVEGRYYEGTVDGLADFGVFVDLGNGVTGLLHRNELDQRLESLDWTEGKTVCVQVKGIDESGEVDLASSIRQSSAEFRGTLEHGADAGPAPDPESVHSESDSSSLLSGRMMDEDLDRTKIRSIEQFFGRDVVLEGVVTDIRQTAGPTVFTLTDESGSVECAAFAGAGVRAYPDLEDEDPVRLRGTVEHRFDDFQIEVEALERLEGLEAEDVVQRVATGESIPESIDELPLLYADPANEAIETELREAAATMRKAVEADRTIRLRHPVTVDGYVAAAALERGIEATAVEDGEFERGRVHRRPLEDPVYDLAAAIEDIEDLVADPTDPNAMVVLVSMGSDTPATEAFDLLDAYGVEYYVIDTTNPKPSTLDRVDPLVNPWCGEGTYPIPTTTSLAVNVAGLLAESNRDDFVHLPAVCEPEDRPATADRLMADSSYDDTDVGRMNEAIAIEAYYQPWEDKRALIRNLLFERPPGSIQPISDQYREKLDRAVETARHNARVSEVDGTTFLALDTASFGNRFEFPPDRVLLRELLAAEHDGDAIGVAIGENALTVVGADSIDLRSLADALDTRLPEAGIDLQGDQSGQIRFLQGCRDELPAATVDAIAATV